MLGWEPEGFVDYAHVLTEHYSLGEVLEIKNIAPGVWNLKTSEGNYGVKAVPFTGERVQFIYEVTQHLLAQGLVGIPQLLLNNENTPYLRRNSQETYYVYPWRKASHLQFNRKNIFKAVKFLGEVHARGERFTTSVADPPQNWGAWTEILQTGSAQLAHWIKNAHEVKGFCDCSEIISLHGSYYLEQSEQAQQLLLNSGYEALIKQEQSLGTFCVRDFELRNLLVDATGQLHLVDLDYCMADVRVYDLARFIQIVASRYAWNWDIGLQMLKQYQNVRPLGEEEKAVLVAMLHFPRKIWLYTKRFYAGEDQGIDLDLAKKLQKTLDEEGKRVAFLNMLRGWSLLKGR